MLTTSAISIDPEIQGGTPCFAGTRVPVKTLFDYLARGRTLDFSIEQLPSVTPSQAVEVLESVKELMDDGLKAA
jgi:uncharacterized protein (DUF433 family)